MPSASGTPRDPSRPYNLLQQQGRPLQTSGTYHGPRGTRTRTAARRTRGAGYPLRARKINFSVGAGSSRLSFLQRRRLILGALACVLAVLLIVGVSSCVRSCTAPHANQKLNPLDARVSAEASEDLTKKLQPALDQADKLQAIAKQAHTYTEEGIIDLALKHPEAIDYVYAWPTTDKVALTTALEGVQKGSLPLLYTFDTHWGYAPYAQKSFALTGSGPCALSAIYMGLTGNNDKTPTVIAQDAEEAKQATGESYMSSAFVESEAKKIGITSKLIVPHADNIAHGLAQDSYLLMETKAGIFGDISHWVVLVSKQADGSVTVFDPTNPDLHTLSFAPATLASNAKNLYVMSVKAS